MDKVKGDGPEDPRLELRALDRIVVLLATIEAELGAASALNHISRATTRDRKK